MKTLGFRQIGVLVFVMCALSARAQRVRGELHLEVHDAQGATISPAAVLVSEANQFHLSFAVAKDGHFIARDLPFGVYRLGLEAQGFATWSSLVEIRSEVPVPTGKRVSEAVVKSDIAIVA